jgi:RNA polymerase sigma-70 factor (ECF subfamily)
MHTLLDMSYEDVAVALQIPIGTVRSRINRARRKLEGARS